MTTTILVIGDMHIGSTVALCKPTVTLDDGGVYKSSRGQLWLWDKWRLMLDHVQYHKQGELYIVVNGDAVEGDIKQRSYQTISRNPATILALAADILDPLARQSAGMFFIMGTAAHSGTSAHLEEQLANDLGGRICDETGASSWWHLSLDVDGVRLDFAHHPGIGVSKNGWTAHNSINTLAARVLFDSANEGRPAPHIVIRSHNHTYRDSRDNYKVRAITTPAWTLATEYIHRIAPGAIADVGAIMITCDNGDYMVGPMIYRRAPDETITIGG